MMPSASEPSQGITLLSKITVTYFQSFLYLSVFLEVKIQVENLKTVLLLFWKNFVEHDYFIKAFYTC